MGFELPKMPKNATDKDKKLYKLTLISMLPKQDILKLIETEQKKTNLKKPIL